METRKTLTEELGEAARLVLGNKLVLAPLVINWLIGLALSALAAPAVATAVKAGTIWSWAFLLYTGGVGALSLLVTSGISHNAYLALQGELFSWDAFFAGVRRYFFPMLATGLAFGAAALFTTMLATPVVLISPLLIGLLAAAFWAGCNYLWQVVMVSNQLGFSETMDRSVAYLKRDFWGTFAIGGGYTLVSGLLSLLINPSVQRLVAGLGRASAPSSQSGPSALISGLLMLGIDMVTRQLFFVHYAGRSQIPQAPVAG